MISAELLSEATLFKEYFQLNCVTKVYLYLKLYVYV